MLGLVLAYLVLGSACALVFSLVLVLAWLVLGFASASSVFVFVGTRHVEWFCPASPKVNRGLPPHEVGC